MSCCSLCGWGLHNCYRRRAGTSGKDKVGSHGESHNAEREKRVRHFASRQRADAIGNGDECRHTPHWRAPSHPRLQRRRSQPVPETSISEATHKQQLSAYGTSVSREERDETIAKGCAPSDGSEQPITMA